MELNKKEKWRYVLIAFFVVGMIFSLVVSVIGQIEDLTGLDVNQTLGLNLTSVMKGRAYESETGVDIDTELLKAFLLYNQTNVYTCFQLRDSSNITYEGAVSDEQIHEVLESQIAYFGNLSEEVLKNLSEDEFVARSDESLALKMSLCGTITQKGLIKLAQDYRIKFIAIPQGGSFAFSLNESMSDEIIRDNQSNVTLHSNETKEPSPESPPNLSVNKYVIISVILMIISLIIILNLLKTKNG